MAGELSDAARDEFRAALLRSAEKIFEAPDAVEALRAFIDGDAFIVLTRDRLWVRPVPAEGDTETAPEPPPDTPGTGMYL